MIRQLKVADIIPQAEQNGILAICALNKLEKERGIYKKVKVGKIGFSFEWRSSKCMWGRFGGGWQWALGFEASKRSLLLNCLIFSVMIWRER